MKPELLAPAGDWEAMRAACANGANAVYFGLSNFNARARAHNFLPSELPEIMQFLHSRNVKGFVTLNTLIFSDELAEVAEFVKLIAKAGVDAVIVQDIGLVRLIHELAPTLHIHASTQMTLTEPRGIELATQLGLDRVVLARELSIKDIRNVTANTKSPVEVFVHGALCVAYSGQCLTSEALGGRSANRGQCAQACRLPYQMVVDGKQIELGDKSYLLSPQDLAAYELIDDLLKAGVISFKIEGRLKGGPYVAAATQMYRTAIDSALANEKFRPERQDEIDLKQTFSRGFTPGFLQGNDHQKLVRGRFPKSRGVLLGRVASISKGGVIVDLAERLPDFAKPGDGVLFDLAKPDQQEPAGRIWYVNPVSPSRVELRFEQDSIDFSIIPVGTIIWRTDDPTITRKLQQSYSQDKAVYREKLTAKIAGQLGGSVVLELSVGEQKESAEWAGPLETAKKRATTKEEIRDQLSRLGDTPFELGIVTIQLPDNVMLPKSVLNDLRRQASIALAAKVARQQTHNLGNENALSDLRSKVKLKAIHTGDASGGSDTAGQGDSAAELTVLVRNLAQLETVLPLRPKMVYCDFEDMRLYKDAVPLANASGIPIALATLRITKPGEEGFHANINRAKPDAVLIRNLGSLTYFKEHLPEAKLIGDFSLNVANELTADYFLNQGLERVVPGFDLNWDQFSALVKRVDPTRLEPVVHQHMPMFHMEHCVFAAFLSKGKDHTDCGRPCDRHRVELNDRVGAAFPVHPDTGCRNTVYNSVPQSAAEYLPRMLALGIRTVRIDLLRETPEEMISLIQNYRNVMSGKDDGKKTWRNLKALNQLGVTRGTLQMA